MSLNSFAFSTWVVAWERFRFWGNEFESHMYNFLSIWMIGKKFLVPAFETVLMIIVLLRHHQPWFLSRAEKISLELGTSFSSINPTSICIGVAFELASETSTTATAPRWVAANLIRRDSVEFIFECIFSPLIWSFPINHKIGYVLKSVKLS